MKPSIPNPSAKRSNRPCKRREWRLASLVMATMMVAAACGGTNQATVQAEPVSDQSGAQQEKASVQESGISVNDDGMSVELGTDGISVELDGDAIGIQVDDNETSDFSAEGADATTPGVASSCTGGPDYTGQLLQKDFSSSDLSCASFTGTIVQGSDFSNTNLSGANFFGSQIQDVDFSDTNLQAVSFSGSVLNNVTFTNSDLTGANFSGSAIVGFAFENTTCPDGTNSDDNESSCGLG